MHDLSDLWSSLCTYSLLWTYFSLSMVFGMHMHSWACLRTFLHMVCVSRILLLLLTQLVLQLHIRSLMLHFQCFIFGNVFTLFYKSFIMIGKAIEFFMCPNCTYWNVNFFYHVPLYWIRQPIWKSSLKCLKSIHLKKGPSQVHMKLIWSSLYKIQYHIRCSFHVNFILNFIFSEKTTFRKKITSTQQNLNFLTFSTSTTIYIYY